MKKTGILNAQLISHIAALGHKDTFMIGDAGMPIPKGVPIVDLILCGGVPTFRQVMDAVLAETAVEGYTIAEEIKEYNPELLGYIREKAGRYGGRDDFPCGIKTDVRTGEICGKDRGIYALSKYYSAGGRSFPGINT